MLFNDHVLNAELDNECTNVLWKLQGTRYYQAAHCTAGNVTGLCHLLCSSHSGNKKIFYTLDDKMERIEDF